VGRRGEIGGEGRFVGRSDREERRNSNVM